MRVNAAVERGNAPPSREEGNARIIPLFPDLPYCPTCQKQFHPAAEHQRYCCPSHRVTGCKKRRKRMSEAFVIIATTMSDGRITVAKALDCIEWNAERCEQVVKAWGYGFDEKDELVRIKGKTA